MAETTTIEVSFLGSTKHIEFSPQHDRVADIEKTICHAFNLPSGSAIALVNEKGSYRVIGPQMSQGSYKLEVANNNNNTADDDEDDDVVIRNCVGGDPTEKAKMLSGQLYKALDPLLVAERQRARNILRRFNNNLDPNKRQEILSKLVGYKVDSGVYIEPPFYVDYGTNIKLGRNVYMNFGCVILDCAQVEIGDNVMFAPNVQIYAAHHPVVASKRNTGLELASPIKIGNNVWIGGNAIILPGVSIGDNTTIGAGSVVTRDIPANVIAVGNPCKVIRQIPS